MSENSDENSIQEQTRKMLIDMLLTSEFRVTKESVGVPFLVGQKVKVVKQNGLNPMMPPSYCIEPTEVRARDDRFMGLFKKIKPTVRDMQGSSLICTDGIVAELVMEEESDG